MKTMVRKFLPGVVLSLCSVILAAVVAARAQSSPQPAASSPYVPPAAAPLPARIEQPAVVTCGACGAQIGAPQPVAVAPQIGAPLWAPRDRRPFAAASSGTCDNGPQWAPGSGTGCAPVYYVGEDRPMTGYDADGRPVVYFVAGTPPIHPVVNYPAPRYTTRYVHGREW
jgi:hypothetical protein